MWSDEADAEAGWITLRLALTEQLRRYGGHLGYGVNEAFRGHRYAARSCALLFPLIRSHGIDPLLITCAADNVASRRTCDLIGASLVAEDHVEREPGLWGDTCYFHLRLNRSQLDSHPEDEP
jgi:tagatose 1,6-diphosphate aldolase